MSACAVRACASYQTSRAGNPTQGLPVSRSSSGLTASQMRSGPRNSPRAAVVSVTGSSHMVSRYRDDEVMSTYR
jgi:hypothetical protein